MNTSSISEKFTINSEEWLNYVQRLEIYFKRNSVNDDVKKKAVMLCIVGSENYKLIRELSAPLTPADKSYEQLKHLISKHLKPAPKQTNIIAERYAFNTRNRKPMESVYSYVEELKTLGKPCEYGNMLDDMVRDRLVCGIGDLDVQYRLMLEGQVCKLTLNDALLIIKSIERERVLYKDSSVSLRCSGDDSSENEKKDDRKEKMESLPKEPVQKSVSVQNSVSSQVKEEQSNDREASVRSSDKQKDNGNKKKVENTNRKIFKNDCFRCGSDHRQETCAYIDTKCFLCKNKGHSIHMCYAIRAEQMKLQDLHADNDELLLSEKKQENVKDCFRCGNKHDPHTCLFKEQECFVCKDKGHSIRMCVVARASILEQEQFICSEDSNNVHYMPSSISENSRKTASTESINTKLSVLQKASELSQSVCFNCGSCQNSYQFKVSASDKLETCSNTTTIPEDSLSFCSEGNKSPLLDSHHSNNTDCFHCGVMCVPDSCPFNDINYLLSMGCEALSKAQVLQHHGNYPSCHHSSNSESTNHSNSQFAKCFHYVEPSSQNSLCCDPKNIIIHNKEPVFRLCHQFA